MTMNRRQFIAGAAAAAAISGCGSEEAETPGRAATRSAAPMPTGVAPTPTTSSAPQATTQPATRFIAHIANAGPVASFTRNQVYDASRAEGYFVVRREGKLFALSSVCTHRGCKVNVEPDQSFICKCHGSRFNPDGAVLNGPATRDLPRLPVADDEEGNLLVKLGEPA